MTVYATLLARGYFPKELPPAFYTDQFAAFASTRQGRLLLTSYNAPGLMECVDYRLALPGLTRRDLRIPHPVAFERLAMIAAKGFSRLLRKAHQSPITRSSASYSDNSARAIQPAFRPANLPRERAISRRGGAFLAKADISNFYPSLYTHAVGWAIDSKLRERANWGNRRFLGKRIDQALMDMQGKESQGIPIGNDLSFLLAEIVLGQVDRKLRIDSSRALRWYDDYEASFDSRADAERFIANLTRELGRFRLRLNPQKTEILALPLPAEDEWRDVLAERAKHPIKTGRDMVQFFDTAFRLRSSFPHAPVLLYALGILFSVRLPEGDAEKVALSGISQALLAEPGVAQKAFALLSYWSINGLKLDQSVVPPTISRMISCHETTGLSSDVAWALSFCLEAHLSLDRRCGKRLSDFEDDAISLLAFHMNDEGLLAAGFSKTQLSKILSREDPDGPHWLAAYEMVRQKHGANAGVSAHPVFSAMLMKDIGFYRRALPRYASLLHPGGAPDWAVGALLRSATKGRRKGKRRFATGSPVVPLVTSDLKKIDTTARSKDQLVAELLGRDFQRLLGSLADNVGPYHTVPPSTRRRHSRD